MCVCVCACGQNRSCGTGSGAQSKYKPSRLFLKVKRKTLLSCHNTSARLSSWKRSHAATSFWFQALATRVPFRFKNHLVKKQGIILKRLFPNGISLTTVEWRWSRLPSFHVASAYPPCICINSTPGAPPSCQSRRVTVADQVSASLRRCGQAPALHSDHTISSKLCVTKIKQLHHFFSPESELQRFNYLQMPAHRSMLVHLAHTAGLY